jgi:cell division protein FtsI (penicillin-binding protein 3)
VMTSKSLRRRSAVAVAFIAASVMLLGARLVDLQVVRAAVLQKESVNAKSVDTTLYGSRGSIVDNTGVTLAATVMRYDVQISPSAAEQSAKTAGQKTLTKQADEIGAVTGQGGAKILQIIQDALKQNPDSQYAQIINGIDASMYDKLTALNISWVYFTSYQARTYPDGAVAGNIVGFVGSSGKPQAGVELANNSCLAGENGSETYQIGADGVTIPGSTVVQKAAKDGGTLKLTINSDLQWFAQQQLAEVVPSLGAQFGFVTIADAKTGQLRAVAQYPSVDPNNIDATSPNYWGSLAFTTPFEPGSTFKSLTSAALIDKGLVTPTTHVLTPYEFNEDGASLHDAGYHAPEQLTLTGVLMLSSNVGMSILGQRLNDNVRYDYLKKFGIGNSTGIAFPGQSDGILNPVNTWDAQTKFATMFGQGVSATQMQMVSAYQALANNGVRVPLSLIEGCTLPDGKTIDTPKPQPEKVVSAKTANTVMQMLETVVTQGEDSKALSIPGYQIAAKTGTAQQPNGQGGYYANKYYVSVMGAVPANDPQYVVSVNIGYPTTITSSAAAAPLFKTIMSQVIKTYRIKPSTTPAPDDPPYY